MAGHGPAVKLGEDKASPAKSKLGIKLFFVYTAVYAAFVLINTVNPKLMEMPMPLGINLAVFYGLGLIILAIIMGLVYNKIATGYEDKLNDKEGK